MKAKFHIAGSVRLPGQCVSHETKEICLAASARNDSF